MSHLLSKRTFLIIVLLCLIVSGALSQDAPSSTNFRSPMDIPLVVAGNFGEVRSNHFHTGIDFKTQGVIGKNIYAIEDGYISRIGYSHYGYGKVLYVTHPSGHTSVYGHLSKFKNPISTFVKKHQYDIQEETFTVYLDSGKIPVKKGQVIALSGNSGGSLAPHLHFEIRETESEHPMNPLLFGYNITDTKKPMINNLKVYALDSNSLVNGIHKDKIIRIKKNKKGNYYLPETLTAYGNIGFALHSTDRINARNICGLYSLNLSVNGEPLFSHKMDKLDFSTSRYVNHHVDYHRHKKYNNSFHKSFLKGNNQLNIYSNTNNGAVFIEHDSTYQFKYSAKDYSGNKSTLNFKIVGDHLEKPLKNIRKDFCLKELKWQKSNFFDTTNFSFLMTSGTLYEDLCFQYKVVTDSNYLSDIYTITGSKQYVGIQNYFKIFVTPTVEIDSQYQSKLCIVSINNKGRISDRGGNYELGKVTTRVKEFGSFALKLDTTKPVLELLSNTDKLTKNSTLVFKIGDNLSGIQSYNATMDGEWILTQYKRKKSRWYISFSESKNLSKGTHTLQIEVIDEKGNSNFQSLELVVK